VESEISVASAWLIHNLQNPENKGCFHGAGGANWKSVFQVRAAIYRAWRQAIHQQSQRLRLQHGQWLDSRVIAAFLSGPPKFDSAQTAAIQQALSLLLCWIGQSSIGL
jgi:hypothetical protein